MDSSDKIKPLSEKIAALLLKNEMAIDLETFNTLTEADKKRIFFGITNRNKREERLQLKNKLNKQKARNTIIDNENQGYTRRKMIYWYSEIAASIVISLNMTFPLNKNDVINTL